MYAKILAAITICALGSFVGCAVQDEPESDVDDVDAESEELGEAQQEIGSCAHPRCTTGAPLSASCDGCVAEICAVDPWCCTNSWDSICVGRVEDCSNTNITCGCSHSAWETGPALGDDCSPCVRRICEVDTFCCNDSWDASCRQYVWEGEIDWAGVVLQECWPE